MRLSFRQAMAGAALCLAVGAVIAAAEGEGRPVRRAVGPPPRPARAPRPRVRIRHGAVRRREVALTFDDGPGPDTPRLVRWLRRHHVPVTFFLVGRAIAAHPGVVRAEARAGDALGDHTYDHAALVRLTPSAQAREVATTAALIRRVTGRPVRLFRPPYGLYDAATLGTLKRERMLMVLWSVDTRDYTRPGVRRIVYTALSGARPGSILLFHDGGGDRTQTLAALPRIVHRLRLKGYRPVTVTRLLAATGRT